MAADAAFVAAARKAAQQPPNKLLQELDYHISESVFAKHQLESLIERRSTMPAGACASCALQAGGEFDPLSDDSQGMKGVAG
jgi:hypothetical protein